MENDQDKFRNKSNPFASKLFSLKESILKEENLKLPLRSNSCLIPSILDFSISYNLDHVPKLK